MNKSVLILLVISVYGHITVKSNSYLNNFDNFYFGLCLQNNNLITIRPTSLRHCLLQCVRRTSCKSVNYHRLSLSCQLKTKYTSTTDIQNCQEFVFWNGTLSDLNHVTDIEVCLNDCHENKTCDVTDGVLTCHVTECSVTLDVHVSHGQLLGNVNTVGSRRYIQCTRGYGIVGNVTSQCQTDGTWSTHGSCIMKCASVPIVNNATIVKAEIHSSDGLLEVISDVNFTELVFLSGTSVEYSCDNGFVMVGTNTSVCSTGAWYPVPACNSVTSSMTSPLETVCNMDEDCMVPNSECRDGVCRCESTLSYSYSEMECVPTCSSFADTFQTEFEKKLPFNDLKKINTNNVTVCKQACLDAPFNCSSFEIDISKRKCRLQRVTGQDKTLSNVNGWTYYQRDCGTSNPTNNHDDAR